MRYQKVSTESNIQVFGYWPVCRPYITQPEIGAVSNVAELVAKIEQQIIDATVLGGICTRVYEDGVYEYHVYEVSCV